MARSRLGTRTESRVGAVDDAMEWVSAMRIAWPTPLSPIAGLRADRRKEDAAAGNASLRASSCGCWQKAKGVADLQGSWAVILHDAFYILNLVRTAEVPITSLQCSCNQTSVKVRYQNGRACGLPQLPSQLTTSLACLLLDFHHGVENDCCRVLRPKQTSTRSRSVFWHGTAFGTAQTSELPWCNPTFISQNPHFL